MNLSELQIDLKEQTKDLHTQAEQHPLMQSFINGTYTREHLLSYLVNLYPIYSVVEQRLLKNTNDVELKRTPFIEKDMHFLINEFYENKKLLTPLDITCEWIGNCWSKPMSLLKAELYTRWLGDLYGGRMLMQTVTPNAMFFCHDIPGTIQKIRNIIDEPNNNIKNDDIINETKKAFNFYLALFDQIYGKA
jgi:heme oxygenase